MSKSKSKNRSKSKTKNENDDFNFSHMKRYAKKSNKKLAKIFIPVRVEIYVNRNIFN